MTEPLSSLIRPELGPVLPSFARFAPPPAANLLAAELESRTSPTDIVIDLHGRGGWVARAAIARLRRAYAFESNPLTQLLAEVVLRPPDLRHFDAAVNALAVQPRGEVGLAQALNDLFASRCATCRRAVVVEEFIWDGDAEAPFRKTYRCPACRDQVGGGEQRSAATDEDDKRRARRQDSPGPAYGVLRDRFPAPADGGELVDALLGLYTPRSLEAIEAILERLDSDLRAAPIEAALRLALLHVVLPASRLHSYPGRVAALRISHGRLRAPGERQWREHNPWHLFEEGCRLVRGFLQRLESAPGGPVQARLGHDLLALADGSANVVLAEGGRRGAAAAAAAAQSVDEDVRDRLRLVLTQPPIRWSTENLSFAYLATALILGREAAAGLPLEPVFGYAPRTEWGWEAATMRRALAGIAPILSPEARVVVMLDPGGPEGLVASALGGVGAGYRLAAALLMEADDRFGGTLEFVPPGARAPGGPRTRANVALEELVPEVAGTDGGSFQLADVEHAVSDLAVVVLQARGEPARFERLLGEVLVGLDRVGHLRRLVGTRTYAETEARSERHAAAYGLLGEPILRLDGTAPEDLVEPEEAEDEEMNDDGSVEIGAEGGTEPVVDIGAPRRQPASAPADSPRVSAGADHVGLLLDLIVGELRREGHPRLQELEPGRWWLREEREIREAALPLSDRVEWAVFSLLSTSGGLSERAFFDRIASMYRGHDTPDEALVRACLESYRSGASTLEMLRTDDELHARYREHTELCGLLVEFGHRLGLRCWVGRTEQRRPYQGRPLMAQLSDAEQRTYLPLVSHGDLDALETTDVIWYLRGKATFLFEVEWTAMIGEPLLRRGPLIPNEEGLVRFLVLVPERTELVRFKLARSLLLRRALEDDNWHILKADHLRRLAAAETADLEQLAPYLGLDPEIERQGEQMPLFG